MSGAKDIRRALMIAKADGGNVGPDIANPVSVFPKPQRMYPEEERVPGGQYLGMPDKADMTGHKSAAASIGIAPDGKPYFTASKDAVDQTGTPGKARAKTNLFKQKAGWRWSAAPEGHENTDTIVSVEHRGKHYYALNAHFPKGVEFSRYAEAKSEPRLRPTTTGDVMLGDQAGSIMVRGREHPVYHHLVVKADGGPVDAPARQLSPLGLYSHGAETAAALKQASGSPDQMLGTMKNMGVKPAEIDAINVQNYLAGKPKVGKQEIADYFRANAPDVKAKTFTGSKARFSNYTLPGGTNYRETLLQLPPPSWHYEGRRDAPLAGAKEKAFSEGLHYPGEYNTVVHLRKKNRDKGKTYHLEEMQSDWGQRGRQFGFGEPLSEEAYHAAMRQYQEAYEAAQRQHGEAYEAAQRQHEKAYEAAMRQRGEAYEAAQRQHGEAYEAAMRPHEEAYRAAKRQYQEAYETAQRQNWEAYRAAMRPHEEAYHADERQYQEAYRAAMRQHEKAYEAAMHPHGEAYHAAIESLDKQRNKVPEAPYVTNTNHWTDLGLKHALFEAAKNDHDRFVWTPGDEQVKRYPDLDEKQAKGLREYYNKILPQRLIALAKEHDPDALIGSHSVDGHTLPSLTMTPKMKASILKNGFKSFAAGGRIGKADGGPMYGADFDTISRYLGRPVGTGLPRYTPPTGGVAPPPDQIAPEDYGTAALKAPAFDPSNNPIDPYGIQRGGLGFDSPNDPSAYKEEAQPGSISAGRALGTIGSIAGKVAGAPFGLVASGIGTALDVVGQNRELSKAYDTLGSTSTGALPGGKLGFPDWASGLVHGLTFGGIGKSPEQSAREALAAAVTNATPAQARQINAYDPAMQELEAQKERNVTAPMTSPFYGAEFDVAPATPETAPPDLGNWGTGLPGEAAEGVSEAAPGGGGGVGDIGGGTSFKRGGMAYASGGSASDDPSVQKALALTAVKGKPSTFNLPGIGAVPAAPIQQIEEAKNKYMAKNFPGKSHAVNEFSPFNVDFAKRVASTFDKLKDDPANKKVRRAYDALIEQTLAQYEAAKATGIDFRFLKPGQTDPYAKSPALGYQDIVKRGRLYVFPTDLGYGQDEAGSMKSQNPLLRRVGKVGNMPNATANDAFRIVHDVFGHFGPGNPFFRHQGEERAYKLHLPMYSKEASPALATELRGQNSWINFGPYADYNRTANSADTKYSEQKAALMPDWAVQPYARGGSPKSSALFEVAPGKIETPDQQSQWEKLHPQAKEAISHKIIGEHLSDWQRATGIDGDVRRGLGGYNGFSNPNYAFTPYNPADLPRAMNEIGHIFGQDEMMGVHDKPFEKSAPTGVVRVHLGRNTTPEYAHDVYTKLRAAGLAGGHTTDLNDGHMDILSGSSLKEAAKIADKINSALDRKHDVSYSLVHAAFPKTGEDYGSNRTYSSGRPEASLPSADHLEGLRSRISERRKALVEEALRQGGGHQGEVTFGDTLAPGRYHPDVVSALMPTTVSAYKGPPLPGQAREDVSPQKHNPQNRQVIAQRLWQQHPASGGASLSPEEAEKEALDFHVKNLLAIYDRTPVDQRKTSRYWYRAAHALGNAYAEEHGIQPRTAHAIMAVLSPQNPWDKNVTQADRVMDALKNRLDQKWTRAMSSVARQGGKEGTGLPFDKGTQETGEHHWSDIEGKTLRQVLEGPHGHERAAMWIRAFDEAHNPTEYNAVSPTGEFIGTMMNKTRSAPDTASWNSYEPIRKAISIWHDPSLENINNEIGNNHKVREFYNVITNPHDPNGVVIDTHAVAAGQLMPHGSSAREVHQNFGTSPSRVEQERMRLAGEPWTPSKKTGSTGATGDYPLHAEAVRRAAWERGIHPSEMQSVTWETVRRLFSDKSRREKNRVKDIWSNYANGSLTHEQAVDQIFGQSVSPPGWASQAGRGLGNISTRSYVKPGEIAEDAPAVKRYPNQKFASGGDVDAALRLTAQYQPPLPGRQHKRGRP